MENQTPQMLIGQVPDEQIAAWKAQHGDVFKVEVDGHVGYLKRPARKDVAYATTLQSNPIRSNEAMLKACWLGGSMEIQTNDAYFFGVQGQLQQLVEVKAAELSKL